MEKLENQLNLEQAFSISVSGGTSPEILLQVLCTLVGSRPVDLIEGSSIDLFRRLCWLKLTKALGDKTLDFALSTTRKALIARGYNLASFDDSGFSTVTAKKCYDSVISNPSIINTYFHIVESSTAEECLLRAAGNLYFRNLTSADKDELAKWKLSEESLNRQAASRGTATLLTEIIDNTSAFVEVLKKEYLWETEMAIENFDEAICETSPNTLGSTHVDYATGNAKDLLIRLVWLLACAPGDLETIRDVRWALRARGYQTKEFVTALFLRCLSADAGRAIANNIERTLECCKTKQFLNLEELILREAYSYLEQVNNESTEISEAEKRFGFKGMSLDSIMKKEGRENRESAFRYVIANLPQIEKSLWMCMTPEYIEIANACTNKEIAAIMTAYCEKIGNTYLYLSDDGKIYIDLIEARSEALVAGLVYLRAYEPTQVDRISKIENALISRGYNVTSSHLKGVASPLDFEVFKTVMKDPVQYLIQLKTDVVNNAEEELLRLAYAVVAPNGCRVYTQEDARHGISVSHVNNWMNPEDLRFAQKRYLSVLENPRDYVKELSVKVESPLEVKIANAARYSPENIDAGPYTGVNPIEDFSKAHVLDVFIRLAYLKAWDGPAIAKFLNSPEGLAAGKVLLSTHNEIVVCENELKRRMYDLTNLYLAGDNYVSVYRAIREEPYVWINMITPSKKFRRVSPLLTYDSKTTYLNFHSAREGFINMEVKTTDGTQKITDFREAHDIELMTRIAFLNTLRPLDSKDVEELLQCSSKLVHRGYNTEKMYVTGDVYKEVYRAVKDNPHYWIKLIENNAFPRRASPLLLWKSDGTTVIRLEDKPPFVLDKERDMPSEETATIKGLTPGRVRKVASTVRHAVGPVTAVTSGRQLAKMLRAPLSAALATKLGVKRQAIAKFLNSPEGLAAVKILLSMIISSLPMSEYNECEHDDGSVSYSPENMLAAVGQALLNDGMADGLDIGMSLLTDPLFAGFGDVIAKVTQLSSEKVRVNVTETKSVETKSAEAKTADISENEVEVEPRRHARART